jgi:DNA-binding HxlR family transcriptional regulator
MSQGNTDVSAQVLAEACPVREVLDRVAGKWSILIVVAAAHGPIRFTDLERAIDGISRRMLTLTLRTAIAHELYESLVGLTDWATRHRATIAAARQRYDARTKSP